MLLLVQEAHTLVSATCAYSASALLTARTHASTPQQLLELQEHDQGIILTDPHQRPPHLPPLH